MAIVDGDGDFGLYRRKGNTDSATSCDKSQLKTRLD